MTREHGDAFTEKWVETSHASGILFDAFAITRLVSWPGERRRDAQARYNDIEARILDETLLKTKAAISEAFVRAARRVLAREGAWRRRAYLAVTRKRRE